MNELDQKINTHFPGLVVRKDLVKTVRGNAIVPSYVLEYLLGQYCATSDEPTIQTGIETVKEILRKHYVHRNEAGLVRSNIKEKGRYKIIDKISVALNDRTDVYEAEFSNLGIKKVLVDPGTIKAYNLIELGPKGTGKSHIYSEFSPHGILISGGEVTVPKLFVNNSTGKIGLVGYWDCVAFDEFAGKQKRVDKALVDIMKNYMANKSFSRGVETLGAEASVVFVGNTQHTLPYMLKHSDLFSELPDKFYDSAFLDRIHFYIPGWEVDIIRGEMFSSGYGFVVDYLAEILRSLRNYDYSDCYKDHFTLSSDISTRDRDGINKTFSGLMKVLFPDGGASKEEIEDLLRLAIEGRKRVKDQLMRIDSTYGKVSFSYLCADGQTTLVSTLEEEEYPNDYHKTISEGKDGKSGSPVVPSETLKDSGPSLKEKHLTFQENQKGISFDTLFGPYLKGATQITVTDPYIRLFYQMRNFMEFLETVVKHKALDEEVSVNLVTTEDEFKGEQQKENLEKMKESASSVGVNFTWEFDGTGTIHARHILTDHGWKISLDRGLDVFQHYEMNDTFIFTNRLQQFRPCKAFEVTFIKADEN